MRCSSKLIEPKDGDLGTPSIGNNLDLPLVSEGGGGSLNP